ncbi:MAG: hypothetical protein KDJ52_35395, partial [Anaerolineae bacterium]|nr:hypothetical protein [Anaerolineae bacterium]
EHETGKGLFLVLNWATCLPFRQKPGFFTAFHGLMLCYPVYYWVDLPSFSHFHALIVCYPNRHSFLNQTDGGVNSSYLHLFSAISSIRDSVLQPPASKRQAAFVAP